MTPPNLISGTTLSVQALLKRICVRPPYFALGNIRFSNTTTTLEATAWAETPSGLELGPMSGAEMGRHAAIAGLCLVALLQKDDRRRYYLARQAECVAHGNDAPFGSPVHFRASLSGVGKRHARAVVTAETEHHPLITFDIGYTILTEETFQRLFSMYRTETSSRFDAYNALLPGHLTRGDDWAEYRVEQVPTSACAGHFENYPALPISVLMGQLMRLAGQILAETPVPYQGVHASTEASDLCWAGESALFRVKRTRRSGLEHHFDCVAFAEERVVGTMSLILKIS